VPRYPGFRVDRPTRLTGRRLPSGHYQEPQHIVIGEHGEIDIAGRSLGRCQPGDKLAGKRELIGEIIVFFDLCFALAGRNRRCNSTSSDDAVSDLPTSLMPTSLMPTSLMPTSLMPTSLMPTSLMPTSLMLIR